MRGVCRDIVIKRVENRWELDDGEGVKRKRRDMRIGTLIIIGLLAAASGVDPVGAVWDGDEDEGGDTMAEEFVIDFISGVAMGVCTHFPWCEALLVWVMSAFLAFWVVGFLIGTVEWPSRREMRRALTVGLVASLFEREH